MPRRSPAESPVGIMIEKRVRISPLSEIELFDLQDNQPDFVTKHIRRDDLPKALFGYFRFGTLFRYKPADSSQIGRHGDIREAGHWESLNNETGIYNLPNLNGSSIISAQVEADNDVAIEHRANAYCACLSIGKFNLDRANLLKSRGNSDLGAYVVYDLKKLRSVLALIASEGSNGENRSLLIRSVDYGAKDLTWFGEDTFIASAQREVLEIFLRIAFIKTTDYEHEEEVRILLVNSNCLGNLPDETEAFGLSDPRITEVIFDHGKF